MRILFQKACTALSVPPHLMIWIIAVLATAGVILRPFHWPEAIWAVSGASLLVRPPALACRRSQTGIGKGADVYLFLTGMMLLSETARQEGLFDWLAAVATRQAKRVWEQTLFAHLRGRHDRHDIPAERCDGRGAHTSRRGCSQSG